MKVRFPALKSPAYKALLKEKAKFFRWEKRPKEPMIFETQSSVRHILECLSRRDRDAISLRIALEQRHIDTGMLGKTKLSKGLINKGVDPNVASRFTGIMKDNKTEWQAWIDPSVLMTAGQSEHFSSCYMNGHQYHGSALVWAASVNAIMFTRQDDSFSSMGWLSRMLFLAIYPDPDKPPMLINGSPYGINSGAQRGLRNWLYERLGYDRADFQACADDHRHSQSLQIMFPRDAYFDPVSKPTYDNAIWPTDMKPQFSFLNALIVRPIFPRWKLNLATIYHCEICGKVGVGANFCDECGDRCRSCGRTFPKTELVHIESQPYCNTCAALMYKTCERCQQNVHKDHVRSVFTAEGKYVVWCLDCIKEHAKTCPDCGNHTEYLEMSTLGKTLCRLCLDRMTSASEGEING